MSESSWVAIICALVAIINILGMAYVTSTNKSILGKVDAICAENTKAHEDMWKRIYGHHHEVTCDSPACQKAKASDVIIPHERG
jgi:16S rRNA C1402 (ribose-2'-O) methylase RsmI